MDIYQIYVMYWHKVEVHKNIEWNGYCWSYRGYGDFKQRRSFYALDVDSETFGSDFNNILKVLKIIHFNFEVFEIDFKFFKFDFEFFKIYFEFFETNLNLSTSVSSFFPICLKNKKSYKLSQIWSQHSALSNLLLKLI